MPEHDRGHIQFRRANLVTSFTGTLLYAAAVIAAPFSSVAALAIVVFVPAMFNIPMLLERDRQSWRTNFDLTAITWLPARGQAICAVELVVRDLTS